MKMLEAYTPAQIRACGQMLERTLAGGRSLEDFLEFTSIVKAQAAYPLMQGFRLVFSVNGDSNSSNEAVLESISYATLKTFLKLQGLFEEREIKAKDIKTAVKKLRKIDFAQTRWGKGKP